jgi:hypothetical protein
MKVPFRLRRLPEPAPATALLVPGYRAEELLRLCVRLGHDPLPAVYPVADGFLVELPRPTAAAVPGALRLRSLAPRLFLPVDADLVPALLPDEATGLTGQRGLVFLPRGRVLEFLPDKPLPVSALVTAAQPARHPWQALPEPPPLAERITEFTLDQPDAPPDVVLEAGGEWIGTEAPRPPESGVPARVAGQVTYGLGRGMAWLGRALHLGWLARAGARSMAAALNLVPRLSEAVLGRQEAALRDLLRDFHEGNVERALRRALPVGDDTYRGAVPGAGARLPTHNLAYSLQDVLGGGSGPASIWFSRDDVLRELQREYRKQAELATRRGDYRRAAFIYAKLLSDYRMAAAVLAQGGLHHDAAVLYLHKVGDASAAAREFEAAGEIDRALQIYRSRNEHELAGDLLRRAGEEELAVAEYRVAADWLVASGRGAYAAGELLLHRARRPDLARGYYEAGWSQRPALSPVPCAVRLAQLYTQAGEVDEVLRLTGEAEEFLRPAGYDGLTAEFFNELARLADRPALARVRDDLRDRALVAIAAKVRQRAAAGPAPGGLVSAMLGQPGTWAAAVVSDAQFAVRSSGPPQHAPACSRPVVSRTTIRARLAIVRAVGWAPVSADVFLGFESGEVFCYQPASGEIVPLPVGGMAINSLAVSDDGDAVAALRQVAPTFWQLESFARTGMDFRVVESRGVQTEGTPWLCPGLARIDDWVAGLWDGERLTFLHGPRLLPKYRHLDITKNYQPATAVLLPSFKSKGISTAVLAFYGKAVWHFGCWKRNIAREEKPLGWGPRFPAGSTLFCPPLSWLRRGQDGLELAGIAEDGNLYWSDLEFENGELSRVATASSSSPERYLAAAAVRAGLVAGVTAGAVHWLRRGPQHLLLAATTEVSLPQAVACFPYYRGNELIVVCGDGTVARVPFAVG